VQQGTIVSAKMLLHEPEESEHELQVSLRLAHFHAQALLAYYGRGESGGTVAPQRTPLPDAINSAANEGGGAAMVRPPSGFADRAAPVADEVAMTTTTAATQPNSRQSGDLTKHGISRGAIPVSSHARK
jgi:hypothetical protein